MWVEGSPTRSCSMFLSYLIIGMDAINRIHTDCPIPTACIQEIVKQPLGIHWTRGRLGMELHGEEGLAAMPHPFIAVIIGIHKPGLEIGGELLNRETVVLGRDKAAFRSLQKAGLILASMSKLELISVATCRQGQQLVPRQI